MNLITNRTQSDVMLGSGAGQYTCEDLNRVEQAVRELCRLAEKLDIHPGIVTKTDWQVTDLFSSENWPTESQMHRYLENVRKLCRAVAVAAHLPKTMEDLTWEGANQIEQALYLIWQQIRNVLSAFRYSGEIFAGEEI